MKHYFKKLTVFLYICIALFAYSCSEENNFVKEQNYRNAKFEQKTFEEVLKIPIFNEAFQKVVKRKGKIENSAMARTVLEEQYDFTITEGAPVKVIEVDGYTSYTMLIKSDGVEKEGFENLIIRIDSENKTVASIVNYKTSLTDLESFTPEFFQSLEKQITPLIEDDEIVQPEDIERITTKHCLTYYFPMCTQLVGQGQYSHNHIYNSETCTNGIAYYSSQTVCFTTTVFENNETSSGNSTTTGSTTTTNTSSTGANGTGTNNTNLIPNVPIPPCDYCSNIEDVNTPCARLKKLFDPTKANIKPDIVHLRTTLNQTVENGVALTKLANENYDNPPLTAGTSNTVRVFAGPGNYGSIHTHPYPGIFPMFSFRDIYSLQQFHQYCVTVDEPEVVIILVCKNSAGVNQTYALKIDNPTTFYNAVIAEMSQIPNYASYLPDHLPQLVEQVDLKFDKLNSLPQNSNIEMTFLNRFSNYGISLYKANTSLTKWDKLDVDNTNISNPTVKPTPCK